MTFPSKKTIAERRGRTVPPLIMPSKYQTEAQMVPADELKGWVIKGAKATKKWAFGMARRVAKKRYVCREKFRPVNLVYSWIPANVALGPPAGSAYSSAYSSARDGG